MPSTSSQRFMDYLQSETGRAALVGAHKQVEIIDPNTMTLPAAHLTAERQGHGKWLISSQTDEHTVRVLPQQPEQQTIKGLLAREFLATSFTANPA